VKAEFDELSWEEGELTSQGITPKVRICRKRKRWTEIEKERWRVTGRQRDGEKETETQRRMARGKATETEAEGEDRVDTEKSGKKPFYFLWVVVGEEALQRENSEGEAVVVKKKTGSRCGAGDVKTGFLKVENASGTS
jgi:hypothetical protein